MSDSFDFQRKVDKHHFFRALLIIYANTSIHYRFIKHTMPTTAITGARETEREREKNHSSVERSRKQNFIVFYSFRISEYIRCVRLINSQAANVSALVFPGRWAKQTNGNWQNAQNVHDFRYFCWISFVDINNECVTSDDDIKLTWKTVTFTSLMNAHQISVLPEQKKPTKKKCRKFISIQWQQQ